MGVVGLFMFAVKCFHILAWPIVALVYPLWASIRAIEADDSSTLKFRKLVAYWVLFYLIFLFEQAFDNLLRWLPFWLYMKLIITCWLVIPNFDGALYVYKHLVSPCLSMDIKVLINKFNARTDFSLKSSNFQDEVKRYVKENGHEALEELVASKPTCREPNIAVQNDVKTVQVTEQIKEVAASEQVKFVPHFPQEVSLMGPDITQTENKKPETDQISSGKVETVGESSEIPVPKQVQKEWTCAICQVTTNSETVLNSHLQGKRHKTACEELKTKTQQSKNKAFMVPEIKKLKDWKDISSKKNNLEAEVKETGLEACDVLVSSDARLTGIDKNNLAAEEIKEISEAGGELSEIPVFNKVQKAWTCSLCQVTLQSQMTLRSHLRGGRHKAACEELKRKNQQSESKKDAAQRRKKYKLQGVRKKYVEYKEPLWWCKLCNISCNSINDMDCHLSGNKHLDRTRESNAAQAAATSKAL